MYAHIVIAHACANSFVCLGIKDYWSSVAQHQQELLYSLPVLPSPGAEYRQVLAVLSTNPVCTYTNPRPCKSQITHTKAPPPLPHPCRSTNSYTQPSRTHICMHPHPTGPTYTQYLRMHLAPSRPHQINLPYTPTVLSCKRHVVKHNALNSSMPCRMAGHACSMSPHIDS